MIEDADADGRGGELGAVPVGELASSSQSDRFEKFAFVLAMIIVIVVLFLPLVSVSLYELGYETKKELAAEEATVGIAVLIRAMARRWLRTGSRSLMRSTVGAYSRTAVRTMTRRAIKSTGRTVAGVVIRESMEITETPDGDEGRPLRSMIGLLVGFFALALSFMGTMFVIGATQRGAVLENGLTLVTAAALAGLPIVAYWLITVTAARPLGVKVTCQTAIDGILIQAYFSGAGSFLPMTTDVTYEGDERKKGVLAFIVIAGLYVMYQLLAWIEGEVDSYPLEFAGAMFLAYCFVFAFPIKPLEGYHVWRKSKLLWLALFIPIVLSFRLMPTAFASFI